MLLDDAGEVVVGQHLLEGVDRDAVGGLALLPFGLGKRGDQFVVVEVDEVRPPPRPRGRDDVRELQLLDRPDGFEACLPEPVGFVALGGDPLDRLLGDVGCELRAHAIRGSPPSRVR